MNASASKVSLDHVVFYAGTDLPALCRQFEALGFFLTPLGHHDSGSINRLVILDGAYIELIGFEAGVSPGIRPELQAQAPGLNALAFRDGPGGPPAARPAGAFRAPLNLARPVTSGKASGVARFRTTTMTEALQNFRVFLCEHLTPEWVWRPEWQAHANGAQRIERIRVGATEAARLRASIGAVMGYATDQGDSFIAGNCTIDVVAAHDAASCLVVSTSDIEAAAQRVQAAGLAATRAPEALARLSVQLPPPAACELVFVQRS